MDWVGLGSVGFGRVGLGLGLGWGWVGVRVGLGLGSGWAFPASQLCTQLTAVTKYAPARAPTIARGTVSSTVTVGSNISYDHLHTALQCMMACMHTYTPGKAPIFDFVLHWIIHGSEVLDVVATGVIRVKLSSSIVV